MSKYISILDLDFNKNDSLGNFKFIKENVLLDEIKNFQKGSVCDLANILAVGWQNDKLKEKIKANFADIFIEYTDFNIPYDDGSMLWDIFSFIYSMYFNDNLSEYKKWLNVGLIYLKNGKEWIIIKLNDKNDFDRQWKIPKRFNYSVLSKLYPWLKIYFIK